MDYRTSTCLIIRGLSFSFTRQTLSEAGKQYSTVCVDLLYMLTSDVDTQEYHPKKSLFSYLAAECLKD